MNPLNKCGKWSQKTRYNTEKAFYGRVQGGNSTFWNQFYF